MVKENKKLRQTLDVYKNIDRMEEQLPKDFIKMMLVMEKTQPTHIQTILHPTPFVVLILFHIRPVM